MNDATNTPLLEKSTNEEEDNQVNHMESTTPLPTVADLAHEFLLFITTNPGTGVCFQDAGWYKSNRVKTISSSSDTFDHAFGERAKTQVYNTTLLRFLGILSPSEDERQRALILAILTACPELVQP